MENVYIIRCDHYDPQQIEAGVASAAKALGVHLPRAGDALLHVDLPWAHPRFAPHAHTHPKVVEGVANALSGASVSISAQSLPFFPTRNSLRKAGYFSVAKSLGAKLVALDEMPSKLVHLAGRPKVDLQVSLPQTWLQASFKITLPKLRGSTLVPFAGSIRHLQSLLPQDLQVNNQRRLPEKMIDLLPDVVPDLIIVDAIQALHRGGELSGEPLDLDLLIVGTHPVAVDMVCALALGLDPAQINFLKEAAARAIGPGSLDEITLLGDLDLEELRARARQVQTVDANIERYPFPEQLKVIRSPNARQAGVSGSLLEVFLILKQAGISLESARETAIVIGKVPEIPRGKSDYATIIFPDDTSRGRYEGYSRVVRLRGRDVPLSKLLSDVPYAMHVFNLNSELGAEYLWDRWMAGLARMFRKKDRSDLLVPSKGGGMGLN